MSSKPDLNEVFVIPLLDGGYAFGRITCHYHTNFCDVFDLLADSPDVPADLAERPLLMRDFQIGSTEFRRFKQGLPLWRATGVHLPAVLPQNRYAQMGLPPRRVDILREEPDVPIPPDQIDKYPIVSSPFPPGTTAKIEVALKRLSVDYLELCKAWREGRLATRPGDPPPRVKAMSRKRAPEVPQQIYIAIPLADEFPVATELERRHALEAQILERKLGTIASAGAGLGVAELLIIPANRRSMSAVRRLVENLAPGATVEWVDG